MSVQRSPALLDALLEHAPVALAFVDADLRCVLVNGAFAALDGHPAGEHSGRRLSELVPQLVGERDELLSDVLRTGRPLRDHERGWSGSPARSVVLDAVAVYSEAGEALGVALTVRDSSEHLLADSRREALLAAEQSARRSSERARRRAAFLARASSALDEALDLMQSLHSFVALIVPDLAHRCGVDLLDEAGRLQPVAVAPAGERLPEQAADLALQVARDSGSRLIDDGMTIAVPLRARGRVLGVLTLARRPLPDRAPFGGEDLELAEELASRLALAVQNMRLHEEQAETARVLQTSLLPGRLPAIEGFELAARFDPAGAGSIVGGDFYDVFATGDGTWALLVGDVCGKGAEAAAVTALARYTLRALGTEPTAPSQALSELNSAMLRQRDDLRYLTMVYATLDMRAQNPLLRFACAGHPSPLLVPGDGSTPRAIDCRGPLLGILGVVSHEETVVGLAPGDAVVLYSDGVTEAQPSSVLTPADIAGRLAGLHDADEIADAVRRIALPGGVPARDDVAVLVLRWTG